MFDAVPEEWSERPLRELAEHISRGSAPSYAAEDTSIWAVSQKCVRDGTFDLDHCRSHTETKAVRNSAFLRAGDICINSTGTGTLGRVALWRGREGRYFADTHVTVVRLDPTKADAAFLAAFLGMPGTRDTIYRECVTGSTNQIELSKTALGELVCPVPPLDEQRRIAEVLRSVDAVLDLNVGIEAHLWTLREIALSELFSATEDEAGESTILGRLPLGWRVAPAEDVCEAVIDCKNRTPPIVEDGFAVVRTMNVRRGRFVWHNLARTDAASFDEWTKRGRPKPGDVLITREAPIGEVCAVPADDPVCLGQRMMLYRPRRTDLLSGFLLYALQSRAVQEHLLRLGGGSTVGHVRVGDIRRLPLPLPGLDKQAEISEALADIDDAIDRASAANERLRGLKRTLASDLLSGSVRVPA